MPSDHEEQRKAIWAERFIEHHDRLLSLAKRNLKPVLCKRVTPEDVVQDTLSAACDKIDFFEKQPEIPLYCKLRIILFQTIATLERYHLQSQKRDAHKEVEVSERDTVATGQINWNLFADTVTGSFTRISREERYELLRKCLAELSENDRLILELRHFDGLSNSECAAALQIEPKAASIRYFRALQRLRQKLTEYTEFKT